MEITNLSELVTKIFISKSEMKRLGVTFESLQENTLSTKLFFMTLCNSLDEKFSGNTCVEIFDLGDSGCVIYFSKRQSKSRISSCFVAQTNNPQKLFDFAKKLMGENIPVKSWLFCDSTFGAEFRLCVEIPQKFSKAFLKMATENFSNFSFDKIAFSQTFEHTENWTLLLENNALQCLSEVN